MRRTTILACATLLLAGRLVLVAATQPAEPTKSLQYSGKMADGTRIEFERIPNFKMTFSNGWTVTTLTPGMDRGGRRFSGTGKAGDKNLAIGGYISTATNSVNLSVTVGIGKAATTESVKLEKAKGEPDKK